MTKNYGSFETADPAEDEPLLATTPAPNSTPSSKSRAIVTLSALAVGSCLLVVAFTGAFTQIFTPSSSSMLETFDAEDYVGSYDYSYGPPGGADLECFGIALEVTCMAIGCCQYDNGECVSAVGKADCYEEMLPPPTAPLAGSCVADCGGSAGTCWCDDLCAGYGDCCADFQAACPLHAAGGAQPPPPPPAAPPTCVEACGSGDFDVEPACWCDTHCAKYGDCCPDFAQACPVLAPPPPPPLSPPPPPKQKQGKDQARPEWMSAEVLSQRPEDATARLDNDPLRRAMLVQRSIKMQATRFAAWMKRSTMGK